MSISKRYIFLKKIEIAFEVEVTLKVESGRVDMNSCVACSTRCFGKTGQTDRDKESVREESEHVIWLSGILQLV